MKKKTILSGTALLMVAALSVQSVEWPSLSVFAKDADFESSKVLQLSFENNVNDTTGKHTVTANGTAAYVGGVNGTKAFDFDGNSYLTLGTDSDLQPENLTVSFWVKRDETMNGEEMLVWCKGEYNNNGWYIGSPWNTATALVFSIGVGTGGPNSGQPVEFSAQMSRDEFFGSNEWVYVTATYDSTSKAAHIYRNGVEVAVNAANTEAAGTIVADTSIKTIGANGGAYSYGGKTTLSIDELEVFSTVATKSDVEALYTKNGGVIDNGNTGDVVDPTEFITDISSYDLSDVDVSDAYLTNAEDNDIEYLLSLDADKLLAGFRETAGLDMKGATRYEGWENSLIGGHTMGHYLTAMAQAVATLPDSDARKTQVEEKLNYIIDTLAECQTATGTGYIFGAKLVDTANVEAQFDNVEAGKTNITTQSWVPWYTMHKILAGLVDTYKYTGNTTALETAKKLGDWVYARATGWSAATKSRVLGIEYGGMNDCLYELYAVTGEDKYAVAAHVFDEDNLFELVNAGTKNALNNKHANTTIPKFLGALNRYVTTNGKTINGEVVDSTKYLEYAENFFDMVVNNHTYITGDNSEWEHFGADNILDAERTNCNCETCNAYNMLKLAKALYMITGNSKYSDYYENTFYNTIMSSQNPETGMTTYFQPMATGYFKVYGTATQSFWCCTGSGMENFTKLSGSIYYYTDEAVIVSQYLSSTLTDTVKNVKITQTSDIPNSDTASFVVNTLDGTDVINTKVSFRLPSWLASDATVLVNGTEVTADIASGYATVSGLKNGDIVTVTLPMEIKAYNLPDNAAVYAFKYGPVVLSAKLGDKNMTTAYTGVSVLIPSAKLIEEQYISDGTETVSVTNGTVENFMSDINNNLVKTNGKLEWSLDNTDANLTFVPHYSQHSERYGIYFNYVSNEGALNATKYVATKAQERFSNALMDTVQPGYGQYENDTLHNMQESGNGSVGDTSDGTSRYAKAGGAFTYTMKVATGEENFLQAIFDKEDNGKTIQISVGDTVVYSETLNYTGTEDQYTVRIPVEASVVDQETYSKKVDGVDVDAVDVKVESADTEDSAKLCNFLYMTKAYSDDTSLTLTSSAGTVVTNNTTKTINVSVDSDVTSVDLTSVLASTYGYLRINGSVVKETVPYTVDLNKNNYVTLTYTVYAEDHETNAVYTVNVTKESDAASRVDADKTLAYFVDCGDYDVTTLSEGDLFGIYNGVTDQAYGKDSVTGYTWGIVDTISSPLKNGTASNVAIVNAAYTDNTWPFETDAAITDGAAKTSTNRYTKNQFENGIDRNMEYDFELPNGEYTVELYFADPWGCSKNAIVAAEGQTVIEAASVGKAETAVVDVTDGVLNLNITSPAETLCLNLSYIKIYMPEAEITTDEDETTVKEEETTTVTSETTTVEETTTVTGETTTVEATTTKGNNATADGDTKTGDNSHVVLYIIMMCGAVIVLAGLANVRIKRKRAVIK